MKSNTDYKITNNLAVILVGEPKTGKTRAMASFPDPYFLDLDKNLNSVIPLMNGKKFWYDQVDKDDKDKPIPEPDQYEYALECLKVAIADPNIKTICIDSITRLSELVVSHIIGKLTIMGVKLRSDTVDAQIRLNDYATFGNLILKLVALCRASGKFVIWTSHQTVDKDEINGAMRYRFSLPGQLKETLGGYFTDVWGTSSTPIAGGKTKYSIRTKPTGYHVALGTSIPLDPEIDVTDKTPEQIWNLLALKLSVAVK